jgi:O-acetyl-ADP-ribose deacetylase (regulator of RNase III)
MAKDFRHYCQISHPKPGDIWAWAGADGKRVVNLLTQEAPKSNKSHPGKATTHNVNLALRHLRKLSEDESFTSIALPKIATGVGGLDWEDVRPLIDNHLGDLDIPIYLYTNYAKGKAGE